MVAPGGNVVAADCLWLPRGRAEGRRAVVVAVVTEIDMTTGWSQGQQRRKCEWRVNLGHKYGRERCEVEKVEFVAHV